jgi:hypothetical protein
MKETRRQLIRRATACGVAALASAPAGAAEEKTSARKKRVLAILGDAYHAVAPLDGALVGRLRKAGWEAVTIMDYAVPWDDFGKFDLIILSREGHEYVTYFKERDSNPAVNSREARWLTPAQEQKFKDYVKAGGRLFLYHDGFGYYPKGGAISRLAKAYFIRHPAIVNIQVAPTGKMPELTAGVTPFTVADEEYEVEMDEGQTSVFLESHSPEHGRAAQGWAHPYGKGKVAVLIPGHNTATIMNPMIRRCTENVTEWLIK